jgi:hypothetical protein
MDLNYLGRKGALQVLQLWVSHFYLGNKLQACPERVAMFQGMAVVLDKEEETCRESGSLDDMIYHRK